MMVVTQTNTETGDEKMEAAYEIEERFGEFRVCRVGSQRFIKAFQTREEAEKFAKRKNDNFALIGWRKKLAASDAAK